jgi:fermentation-respiration switch protein FrsA (DUF1100 family)
MRFLTNRLRRNLAAGAVLCLGLGLLFSWLVGGELCKTTNHAVNLPANFHAESIAFPSASGSNIRGWLIVPPTNHGVVIIQHGVRGCRADGVARARFLSAAGYAVLLFDFQAHGESLGKNITFGHLESRDSQAAVAFVKERFPAQPIAVIGQSLGGAAARLAQPPLDVQALVIESAYPTVVEATKDRLELALGRPARVLSPLLTGQLRWRIGIGPEALRPIDRVGEIRAPKLFLHGSADPRTKLAEAQELFARAAAPKQFLAVENAGHEDLHGFLGQRYEQLILDFLKENLK